MNIENIKDLKNMIEMFVKEEKTTSVFSFYNWVESQTCKFGCHCELEDGQKPDGCVIDTNERHLCMYASDIKSKEECKYWKKVLDI